MQEKKPPVTAARSCWGHKTWQGLRNPAEGHRDQNNITGVVSVNLKNHQFANCRGETEKSERTRSFVLITLVIDDTLVINLISRR